MTVLQAPPKIESLPDWLNRFESDDGIVYISENRPYKFSEAEYDSYYNMSADDTSGRGIVNLIRLCDGDFNGPLLELGCGSGKLTQGICNTNAFPHLVVTDGSKAFLDLTREKLRAHGSDLDRVSLATLLDSDMDKLPANSLSAIVMRSTLHHFLDVEGFFKAAANTLRPGGVLIAQEPCAGGYLLMGVLAKMLTGPIGAGLTDEQKTKAGHMADTMAAYNRCDLDKTEWEDKHIFRPELIHEWAQSCGLIARHFANHEFEDFAQEPFKEEYLPMRHFMEAYLNYCMGFGAEDAAAMMAPLAPYCDYLEQAAAGTREPYLMSVFVLQKPRT